MKPGLGLGMTCQACPVQRAVSELLPELPTAQTSPDDVAETSLKLENATRGLRTSCHSEPFQWTVNVFAPASPTAQMSSGPTAATPSSCVYSLGEVGLGTTLHFVPSQCSINVRLTPPLAYSPTAHTL